MELYPIATIWNNDALINQDHVTFFKIGLGFNPNNVKARVSIREDIHLALVEVYIDIIPPQSCFFTISQNNNVMQITREQYQLHQHENRKYQIQQVAESFPSSPITDEVKYHLTQMVHQAIESDNEDTVRQVYNFFVNEFYPQLQALTSNTKENENTENNPEGASMAIAP